MDEVKRFDDLAHRRRLSVKPGLTCLWQVSGRNDLRDFREWVRLDLEYIDHWSFWLDLKILCRTVPAVLRGAGAEVNLELQRRLDDCEGNPNEKKTGARAAGFRGDRGGGFSGLPSG